MMMETSMYTFQFFCVKELLGSGKPGRIQYLRCTHFQDMKAWPEYWMGLPPFWYATHVVTPFLYLSNTYATRVQYFGSGIMHDELKAQYNNPFPIEHAMIELNDPTIKAEITRSLFHIAVCCVEGFTILGEKMSFDRDIENENPVLHTILDPDNPDKYIKLGGRQHVSHPHMIHEFIRSGRMRHESALKGGIPVDGPSTDGYANHKNL